MRMIFLFWASDVGQPVPRVRTGGGGRGAPRGRGPRMRGQRATRACMGWWWTWCETIWRLYRDYTAGTLHLQLGGSQGVNRCHIIPTWLLKPKVEKTVTRGIARFREISCDLLDLRIYVVEDYKEATVKI